jgi:hypothetical protein
MRKCVRPKLELIDELKAELEKEYPNFVFEHVIWIISFNQYLATIPIDKNGKYVLHHLCEKEVPFDQVKNS